jgi:hypothetical protein
MIVLTGNVPGTPYSAYKVPPIIITQSSQYLYHAVIMIYKLKIVL